MDKAVIRYGHFLAKVISEDSIRKESSLPFCSSYELVLKVYHLIVLILGYCDNISVSGKLLPGTALQDGRTAQQSSCCCYTQYRNQYADFL